MKRIRYIVVCIILLLATGAAAQVVEILPQAEAIETYFYEDLYPGYQITYSGVAPDGTFLLGSNSGSSGILYHLDAQGTLLHAYEVSDPEYPDCSLTLRGASMVDDCIVMIASSNRPSGSVVALGMPDGSVEFIQRLSGYCHDAVALEDGLLVCGSEWKDEDEECVWVAKINGDGEVVWKYTGTPRDVKESGTWRYAEFCNTFGDEYVALCYDTPDEYSMIRLSDEGEVLFETELVIDHLYGGWLSNTYDLGDVLLLYGGLYDEDGVRYATIMAFDRQGNLLWQNTEEQWFSFRNVIYTGDELYLLAVEQIQGVGIYYYLSQMDLEGNLLKTWEWTLEDPQQWSDGNITAMLTDQDNNIWVAGRVTGVTLFLQLCELE